MRRRPAHRLPPQDPEPRVLVRLVAGSVVDTTFVLDAIVQVDGDDLGEPVAIVLARPDTKWFDAAVEHLLDEWATRSETVLLSVTHGRHGSVAELHCPSRPTTVRLDLLDVA